MELIIEYSIFDKRTAGIIIENDELGGLNEYLTEISNDSLIKSKEELEEHIQDFIWNNVDLQATLVDRDIIDEILSVSSKSPLIQQLIVKYHHLITANCCVNMVGNYCSTCGKKLK